MKDDRLRVAVDMPYVEAIGRATYVFAVLEWNAVYCCERMQGGYINSLAKKTAGKVAKDLVRLVSKLPNQQDKIDCSSPAQEFKRLVVVRNRIVHGKPGTASNCDQRLFHDGTPLTPAMIDDAADEFAACSAELNTLLYNQLKLLVI